MIVSLKMRVSENVDLGVSLTPILKDSSVRKNVQAMGLKYHFFYFIQALE